MCVAQSIYFCYDFLKVDHMLAYTRISCNKCSQNYSPGQRFYSFLQVRKKLKKACLAQIEAKSNLLCENEASLPKPLIPCEIQSSSLDVGWICNFYVRIMYLQLLETRERANQKLLARDSLSLYQHEHFLYMKINVRK